MMNPTSHDRPAAGRRASLRLLLLILGSGLATLPTHGNAQPVGGIRGQVVSDGRPVQDALVELLQESRVVRTARSDAEGTFLFVAVPAGHYDLQVQHVSYHAATERGVQVVAGETRTATIAMRSQLVTLDPLAAAYIGVRIDRRSTEFATRISEQQIRLLPIGRDPKSIVALTPGARPGHVWGGATNQANNYQIDGLAANHPGVGGDFLELNVNWIDRIEVRGLGAGAEHGNFQGGLVNMVTKSGGNSRSTFLRSSLESHVLNASNLESTEIGSEVRIRRDAELELSGPVVRDRLFYFLSGQLIEQDDRFINHLPEIGERYSPVLRENLETKLFGKVTFTPRARDLLEASFIRNHASTANGGNTGYQTGDATWDQDRLTTLYSLQWQHNRDWVVLEAKASRMSLDETREPHHGHELPGIETFGLLPPFVAFQNAPLRFRHAPATTSAMVAATLRARVAGQDQLLKLGAERSGGTHIDQRLRNGGVTWRPGRRPSLDPADPATWRISSSYPLIGVSTGGEVDLHARVENGAIFAQAALVLGERLVLTPGLRLGRWAGHITPGRGAGPEFQAVQATGLDPRMGGILDITGRGNFVVKAHWGRYHQSMIAQFYDRVEGGNVFTNEELWHYAGPMPGPGHSFTAAEQEQLVRDGLLRHQRSIILNETGPVGAYRQPYIDQWLAGVERSFGSSVKLEGLYLNRRNRQMVSLVDRNAATNYTRFEYVNVLGPDGQHINFEGGRVQFRELYVPNSAIIQVLRLQAQGLCVDGCSVPPGFVPADTLRLSWDPDYVITNVPQARREFGQLQLAVHVDRRSWGGSVSLVYTALQGDLDTVTGYEDPAGYGAGPFVRVNEGVNAFGRLPNFSPRELKVSLFGNLPWNTQGGVFWTWASGDHFSPHFTVTQLGGYSYQTHYGRRAVWAPLLADLEGHRIFLGPRGRPRLEARGIFDVRLERTMSLGSSRDWQLSLDLFNIVNMSTVTRVNASANHGRNFYYFLGPNREGLFRTTDESVFYRAVHERVPPRTIRIGAGVRI